MSDKRFEIAPPDRDGRRCVCEWLEITREGERHVFEYFREHMPAPEAAPVATPSDAVTRDVVAEAQRAYCASIKSSDHAEWCGGDSCCDIGMTSSLRTFAQAYQVTRFRIEQSLPLHVQRHDPEYSVRVHDLTMHALLPEVKP
jgi:hypothetical protein